MDLKLKGKAAVITGGTQGIGKEIAEILANEGVKITIVGLNEEILNRTCQEFNKKGYQVLGVRCDVTKEEDVADAFEMTKKTFGRVDILVNNAGIGGWAAPIQDATVEAWNKVFDVNMLGVFLCSKYAFRYMIPQQGGVVLSIGSFAGKRGTLFGDNIAYSASKAGVIGFTKALSIEGCRHNIRTVCVCPGVVNTDILKFHTEERRAMLNKMVPIGQMAEPVEIARVVAFLCSDMASHITGEVIDVNGGLFTD